MSGEIMVNSIDAAEDIADLVRSRRCLVDARNRLSKLRNESQTSWEGQAAVQFVALMDGFISRIDGLLARNDNIQTSINMIINTFSEFDQALKK